VDNYRYLTFQQDDNYKISLWILRIPFYKEYCFLADNLWEYLFRMLWLREIEDHLSSQAIFRDCLAEIIPADIKNMELSKCIT